jgi:hypothetical protein
MVEAAAFTAAADFTVVAASMAVAGSTVAAVASTLVPPSTAAGPCSEVVEALLSMGATPSEAADRVLCSMAVARCFMAAAVHGRSSMAEAIIIIRTMPTGRTSTTIGGTSTAIAVTIIRPTRPAIIIPTVAAALSGPITDRAASATTGIGGDIIGGTITAGTIVITATTGAITDEAESSSTTWKDAQRRPSVV